MAVCNACVQIFPVECANVSSGPFGFAPVSSGAQIQLRCHQDRPYHPTDPKTQQPQFNDVDVLVPVSSSAPDIATGKRARVGGGTDGGIEISAQGREGDATITHQVRTDRPARSPPFKLECTCAVQLLRLHPTIRNNPIIRHRTDLP